MDRYDGWLSSDAVPQGFFFDDDGDPGTNAILVANLEDDRWFSRGDVPIVDPTTGEVFTDATLCSKVAKGTSCYLEHTINDLAGLNLNYSMILGDITNWSIYNSESEIASFTIRLSAERASVTQTPEPGSLIGLLGLAGWGLAALRPKK